MLEKYHRCFVSNASLVYLVTQSGRSFETFCYILFHIKGLTAEPVTNIIVRVKRLYFVFTKLRMDMYMFYIMFQNMGINHSFAECLQNLKYSYHKTMNMDKSYSALK